MFDQFTLGIEEEFQIVDPKTRELRSHVSEFLEEGKMILGEQIKPEMIQSMIEVGTGICKNINEARADITRLRSIISGLAGKTGLAIVAASTHPFLPLAGSKNLRRRKILAAGSGTTNGCPIALDLRFACACRRCRLRAPHTHHERGPLFPAARPRAHNVVAFLDGT